MARDSFDPAPVNPVGIGEVQVILRIKAGSPPTYSASYSFDQLASDGTIMQTRTGNLIPHLTTTQRNNAMAFMDAMLAKAQASVAP